MALEFVQAYCSKQKCFNSHNEISPSIVPIANIPAEFQQLVIPFHAGQPNFNMLKTKSPCRVRGVQLLKCSNAGVFCHGKFACFCFTPCTANLQLYYIGSNAPIYQLHAPPSSWGSGWGFDRPKIQIPHRLGKFGDQIPSFKSLQLLNLHGGLIKPKVKFPTPKGSLAQQTFCRK